MFDGEAPHEKTQPELADAVRNILRPPARSQEEHERMHANDVNNVWFGVTKDSAGECIFEEGPIYEDLTRERLSTGSSGIFPGLISFVGGTGQTSAVVT